MTDGLDFGLLLIRVVIGVTVALHGYNKFFGGGRIAGTARWFESLGMRPNGRIHAYLAATTEIGCGLAFAAGFLTPLSAAGLVGVMVVATWTHRGNGFFVFKDGWEYNIVIAAVAIGVATIGPGRFSVDHALELGFATSYPKWGFGLSAGLGIASGVGLLALCWRPPAPAPAPAPAAEDDEA